MNKLNEIFFFIITLYIYYIYNIETHQKNLIIIKCNNNIYINLLNLNHTKKIILQKYYIYSN